MKYERFFVAALLLVFFISALASLQHKGLTIDELAHIPAGYSYVTQHDFRLNAEHPALMKTLAGLSLQAIDVDFPEDHPSWHKSRTSSGQQWVLGAQMFYFRNNDADTLLFWARLPMILTALLLGFYVHKWAKEWYGPKAGLFALTLFAFSPNFLAHARLVTTDVGVTTFSFITIYYWLKFLEKPSWEHTIKTGVALGLALAAKFTAVILALVLPLVAISQMTSKQQKDVKGYLYRYSLPVTVTATIAFVTVALCYQIVGFPSYIGGLIKVLWHSSAGHNGFLMGMHSTEGWWYYFIVTTLVKTPIALLLFLVLRPFQNDPKAFNQKTLALLIPASIFFITFMFNKINIGHRHVLLMYPFLWVWVSPLMNLKDAKRYAIYALTAWYIISSLFIFPHYLSYFNEFVGPDNGHEYLIDSNIDWGQDLKGLDYYMEQNNIPHINTAYFGLDSKDNRRMNTTELACYPQAGLHAVSVTRLQGLKAEDKSCLAWLRPIEPIDQIGYSIKIYNITSTQAESLQHAFCKNKCAQVCAADGKALERSRPNATQQKCGCSCF